MPRIRRNPSREYSFIRSLFQACYDNPLFQQEEAKFSPDVEKKPRSKDYTPADEIPEIEFNEKNDATNRRKLCLIGFIVCCVAVIGFLVGYLVSSPKKNDSTYPKDSVSTTTVASTVPSFSFKTDTFNGSMLLIAGPLSKYTSEYADQGSTEYQYFSKIFLYKMNLTFQQSPYSSQYSSTVINEIRPQNGQLSRVLFSLKFTSSINIHNSTESSIVSLLVSGFRNGVMEASADSIKIAALKNEAPIIPTVHPGQCFTVHLKQCVNKTTYLDATLPNAFGHTTLSEVLESSDNKPRLFDTECYGYAQDFWCSAYNPECKSGQPELPCKDYCIDVKSACENSTFPLDCNTLPTTNCRKNPFIPGKCVDVPFGGVYNKCISIGFSHSALPNYNLEVKFPKPNSHLDLIFNFQKLTKCYKHSELFGCSVFVPKCSGSSVVPQHTIPPCKSLCEEYKKNCFVFWEIFALPWPKNLNCSSLPDVNDSSVCIGYKEAHEPPEVKECQASQITCDAGRCLDYSFLCDGYRDCEDNSDEAHCAACSSGEYRCNPASSLCIKKSEVCNGVPDCYEEVEEAECIKLGNGSSRGVVRVYNAESDDWEEVCSDDWNDTLSGLVCRQLGYRGVKNTSFISKSSTSASKIDLGGVNASANTDYIQSFLRKSAVCAGSSVVHLTCGDPVCGTRPAYFPSPLRIVNGDQVKPGTWPFQVALYGGDKLHYFCGGSILNENWIVTAAHCLGEKTTIGDLTVAAGDTRRFAFNKYRQLRTPKSLHIHQGYSSETVQNDIALIQLASPLYFNDYVRPVCLPSNVTDEGTRCFAIGWGKVNDKALDYEPVLRQVSLDVVSWQGCKHAIATSGIQSPYALSEDMMCAGGSRGHDGCQGDSGGPLLCPEVVGTDTWTLSGVTSWGLGCAVPNVPGIYTEIYKFLDWIGNITNNELPMA
ncbi:atrial natriuretic peptide-converting enzyme-like isoform X1 [Crassostrea angulata]|uniref:atrial natriuretic peptide-converting enzyme-like isoform X1 n=1 Tax=Magallana angulata TaxID=2784310 RepID=UPI0022B17B7F|nr:atrial natriuretic peptide-converting enzyme-like isoform X1 [Crassostrea angulata]